MLGDSEPGNCYNGGTLFDLVKGTPMKITAIEVRHHSKGRYSASVERGRVVRSYRLTTASWLRVMLDAAKYSWGIIEVNEYTNRVTF